jgi:hypothetical protein
MDRSSFLGAALSSVTIPIMSDRQGNLTQYSPKLDLSNDVAAVTGDHWGSAPLFYFYDAANQKLRDPAFFSNPHEQTLQTAALSTASGALVTIAPLFYHASRNTYPNGDLKEEFAIKLSLLQSAAAITKPLSWLNNILLLTGSSQKYNAQSQPVPENNVISGINQSTTQGMSLPGGQGQISLDLVATLYNEPWLFKTLGSILQGLGVVESVAGKVSLALAEIPAPAIALANSALSIVSAALVQPGFQHLYASNATVNIIATQSAANGITGNAWFIRKRNPTPFYYVVIPQAQAADFTNLVNPASGAGKVVMQPDGQITVPASGNLAIENFDYLTFQAYADDAT